MVILVIASFLPIWRCGLRDNLNFWEWLYEHTIWGSPVEYVPEEKYLEQLSFEGE
ncbi:hypothetical protein ES703_15821 [subsurface metagenome]